MKAGRTIRNGQPEKGIALLISIFVLLLISVVAISLIVSSGTETSLAGNYRSATSVNYAALAGLEEARGRLLPNNPGYINNSVPGFISSAGTIPLKTVLYITNPASGEPDPTSTYPDTEYDTEFGKGFLAAATVYKTSSVSTVAGIQGPMYKWVRINAISETSLHLDVDGNGIDAAPAIFYDGAQPTGKQLTVNPTPTSAQVLEITSLAVLPNGSQKLLQYLVVFSNRNPGLAANLNFPASLTMDGPIGTFVSSEYSDFYMSGVDGEKGGPYPSPCSPNDPTKYAIGATSQASAQEIKKGIPVYNGSYAYANYRGIAPDPSIGDISNSLIHAFQTVDSLYGPEGLVQTITGIAYHVVSGNATCSSNPCPTGLPDLGTSSSPVTTVVQGDLTLGFASSSGAVQVSGYGLLLVTGKLTLYGNVSWHGIILVIGQGEVEEPSFGSGEIDGAILIAKTRDASNALLQSLGSVTFNMQPTNGNFGFWYNSCWVQAAQPSGSAYKVLSFHEIAQN